MTFLACLTETGNASKTAVRLTLKSAGVLGLLIAPVLLVGTVAANDLAEQPLAMGLETSASLDSGEFSRSDVLDWYSEQVRLIAEQTRLSGELSYADILRHVYPEGGLSERTLSTKAAWREAWADTYLFVSDYGSVNDPVIVADFESIRNRKLGSTLVARYEARGHIVRVSDLATDHTLLHEAGHSLQRKALLETPFAKTAFVSASYQDRGADGKPSAPESKMDSMTLRRLEYLTSQDELEVRMQDLNRFYAICIAGRPIETPLEALTALRMLGMPVSADEAERVFRDTEWEAGLDTLKTPECDASDVDRFNATFEDASELLLLRRLMQSWDKTLWIRCLEKILYEAPGHF